ncbi:stalk domain-containing protein [Peptoniphilus indolicus]|uniref:Copper amine oxidase domain protein n=2 Tax=Peptoniphilus indolicus TaxID=33030 RepID=G4D0X0_9FIRM|nr:stalk domain-containing protein [Peptoniphilus indolicus]EGY80866.1 hypothetical protein HMPREF9129_0050 [Peptoniphilus indolicus ATCC 29427]SUB74746.1 ATPase involved in DNA repair [Peptoniphilus indolicus]
MNKINRKRITSVALAFTLAVAAPVKANFSNFNLELNKVAAAEAKTPTQDEAKAAAEAATTAAEEANKRVKEASGELKTATGDLEEAKKLEGEAKEAAEAATTAAKAATTAAEEASKAQEAISLAKSANISSKSAKEKAARIMGLIEEAKNKEEQAKQEKTAQEKAKAELKSAIDTAKGSLSTATSDVYTQDSIDKLKAAIATAEGIYKDDTKKSTDYTTAKANLEKVKLEKKTVKPTPAPTSVTLNRPTVYYNKVTGRTTPYATVTLYRNRSKVDYVKADRYGDYTINYRFGDYRYNGYNGTASVSSYGDRYVSGYTTANTYVQAYNNGEYLGSAYSDSRGYYTINFNKYVYNRNNTVVYTNGYNNSYNNGYGYYDLSDYYLEAELDGKYSERQYLNKAYIDRYYNNGYYNNYAYAPRITQAIAGTSTVKGSGVNGYATVAVYDSKGIRLGSGTAYSNGEFTISLNRDLKAGEEIKVTANYSNLRENNTTYKVAGESKKDTYNYVVNLTIGDKRLTTTKDGVTTTTTMDVEAYIKEGRTMLPIRFVAQALGYNVTFNDTTRLATFTDGKKVVIINIDSRDFYVDGIKNTFSVDPEIKQGRTMLPISEIGKALGMTTGNKGDNKNIEWDSVRREVKIQLTK